MTSGNLNSSYGTPAERLVTLSPGVGLVVYFLAVPPLAGTPAIH